jgi:hypothetical protein
MKIAFFQAKCNKCKAVFETPLLSDFCYGEFIASSSNGALTAYLNALEEPVVKEINLIFDKLFEIYGSNLNKSSCFKFVVGKCSDMIQGQEMRLDLLPLCPYCGSNDFNYNNLQPVGRRDIERLSFNSFVGLGNDKKEALIKGYINEFNELKK